MQASIREVAIVPSSCKEACLGKKVSAPAAYLHARELQVRILGLIAVNATVAPAGWP